ncbi:MAG: hypothetical protein EXR08_09550 [Alphaproteobacteria bacterium]|nr:hypothetical protein [Alphaproteobacteria bacterium]
MKIDVARRAPIALAGFLLGLGLLFLISGKAVSQVSGNGHGPLIISAEQIILEEPNSRPYTEEGFTFTPASAVRDWVKTRLRADGAPGTVRIIVLDASMGRQELKITRGPRGWFTDDQKYRYDGRIRLRAVYEPVGGQRSASQAEAEATGFFTISEDATLNQLEKKAGDLVADLMQRTALELENNMLRYMPGVVR